MTLHVHANNRERCLEGYLLSFWNFPDISGSLASWHHVTLYFVGTGRFGKLFKCCLRLLFRIIQESPLQLWHKVVTMWFAWPSVMITSGVFCDTPAFVRTFKFCNKIVWMCVSVWCCAHEDSLTLTCHVSCRDTWCLYSSLWRRLYGDCYESFVELS